MSVKIKAKNPSNQLQTLLCDANGRLMVDAEVQIDNVGLATSALQAGGLPSALSGDNLKVSLKETITVPVSNTTLTNLDNAINSDKVDVNIASGVIPLPSGASTSALQAGGLPSALSGDNLKVSLKETITVPVSNTTLTNLNNCIDSNELQVDIVASALPSGASTATLQGGGLPSALSTDNLKVSLKETITVPVSNTTLTNLNNCIDSNELQVDIVASALPSGASTATLQGGGLPSALSTDNLKVSLKETITVPVSNAVLTSLDNCIDSNELQVDIVASALPSGASTATLQGGGLPSALSGDNLKVSLKETITVPVSNAVLTSLDNCIDSNELQVDIVASALPSGASTATLQGGGLPSALSTDNLKVSLKETITVPVSNAVLTSLDNCIDSNELQVDIVASALPSGASTATLQGGGLPSALSGDNLKVSLKETITVPVSNAVLTSFDNAINSNRVDVNIANGNISGFATDTLQGGGLPSALSTDNLKVSLKETITVPVSNAGLTALNSAVNSDRVDVNIANGGFDGAITNAGLTSLNNCIGLNKVNVNIASNAVDFATQTTLALAEAHLGNIETKNTLQTSAEIKELLNNATVNQGTLSAELDTEHYEKIRLFGETSASVGSDIKIFGSNTSGGTYYYLNNGDLMATSLSVSGVGTVHYIGGSFENIPRYIKIFNNSGSTDHTFTKLYMVGSGGRLAV